MSGIWLASVRKWLRRLVGGARLDPLRGIEPGRARLIVGLGNPGPEFAHTRHNVGYRCVDELARQLGARWLDRTANLKSFVALREQAGLTLVLAKPNTFMNRSGEALAKLINHVGPQLEHCLIVYDDMDLTFGTLRLRERGSPSTHNGMRSVVASLQADTIPRLRIGISQASPGSATRHVLGEFEADERSAVDELVERAAKAALAWAIDGAPAAMNRYNSSRTTS